MKSDGYKIAREAALKSNKVNHFFTPLKANDDSLEFAAEEVTLGFSYY